MPSVGLGSDSKGRQITLNVPLDLHTWLKQEAKRRNCTILHLIGDCVRAYKKLVPDSCEIKRAEQKSTYIPVDF